MKQRFNTQVFSSSDNSISFSVIVRGGSDDDNRPMWKLYQSPDKGTMAIYYNPNRGFSFRDKESGEEANFDLEDIYDFIDIFNEVYKALRKENIFFLDSSNKLVPNEQLIKESSIMFNGRFCSIGLKPGLVKRWNNNTRKYEQSEGIIFLLNNKVVAHMDHVDCRKLNKILNKTDWYSFVEASLTNSRRRPNGQKEE